MAKYGGFNYRGSYYGEIPRLPFSVEPFQAVAVDYQKVYLSWGPPQGAVNGLRLVRNQDGYGEWPEDGVVLFERNSLDGQFGDTYYVDGEDNFDENDVNPNNEIPLVSGKFVYYRMWVRRSETNLWTQADDVVVLLPKEHGTITPDNQTLLTTHENFMDLLPRVFTSASQSPLDEVDTSSDLYTFLKAFSFTLDEMLTFADLVLPDFSGRFTNPAIVDLQVAEFGLTPASDETILRQKKLIREAIYMYSRKGTFTALSTLIEALTSYAPTIEQAPNLFLSNQDSTFNGSIGSWVAEGDGTFTSVIEVAVPSGEDFQIDNEYSGKIIANSPGFKITNGSTAPITRGIPVKRGVEYTFSFFSQRTAAGAMSVRPEIVWYDSAGNQVGSATGTSTALTVSWDRYSVTGTAPGTSFSVVSYEVTGNTVSLITDVTHNISAGTIISVLGIGAPYNGSYTVAAVTPTIISYALTTPDVLNTATTALVLSTPAVYASVGISAVTVGTAYVDMMQFATSDVAPYYEARSVQIFLAPNKTNYINDPTFSEVTADWTIAGSSSIAYPTSNLPFVYTSDTMLEVVTNVGVDTVISADVIGAGKPVGKFYTFSVHAQVPAGDETVNLSVNVIDSVNTSLSFVSEDFVLGAEWQRPYVTFFVPSQFVSSSMIFELAITSTTSNGYVINLDAAQLETSFNPTIYIDGNFPPEYGIVWEGLANDSPSHLYKNKQDKIIRLLQELENFLPSNTPYVVNSYGGVETKAITM